jgi:hypothetical protein
MMKGLIARSQNSAVKPIRRANPIRHVPIESLDHMTKTPPHKTSTKMLVEKPVVAAKKPVPQVTSKGQQGIKVRTQSNLNMNKENNLPNYNAKPSQKLPTIVKGGQYSEKVDEMILEEQKTDFLKSKEELNYYEKVVEPIEIEVGPTLDLDLMLEIDYGNIIEEDIFVNQPDFSQCLFNTDIKKNLRARMIDWMIEVLGNYHLYTSHQTFFLAVSIMDLYFKHSKKRIGDNDVHLSGVAAMFLASKYDDVYHIPLKDFVSRVSHDKFSAEDIKEKEWEILKAVDYNVSFPTVLSYLERLIYKNFHEDSCNMLQNIKDAAIHILRMCIHDYSIISFPPLTLALAVLCYCIKCYFYSLSEENSKFGNPIDLTEQENALIQSILQGCEQVSIQSVEDCMYQVNELTHDFEKKYPELKNLKKFSDIQTK